MNAVGNRFISVLERIRVAIDPITRRWLGSPLDDAQAADAGMRPFELEADALISRQRTHRAQKIVRAALAVTVLLVTHRTSLLSMVDRVIVIDNGRVVADGPRERIMEALQSGRIAKAA